MLGVPGMIAAITEGTYIDAIKRTAVRVLTANLPTQNDDSTNH